MKQVAVISKKLNSITKENADIKDEVKEISQFLTDNDFAIVNANAQDQQPYGEQHSSHFAIPYHHDFPRYQWEYSPNGSFSSPTPRRIAPRGYPKDHHYYTLVLQCRDGDLPAFKHQCLFLKDHHCLNQILHYLMLDF